MAPGNAGSTSHPVTAKSQPGAAAAIAVDELREPLLTGLI